MNFDLQQAAERAVEWIEIVPPEAMGNPATAAECWIHLRRLAKAWRAMEPRPLERYEKRCSLCGCEWKSEEYPSPCPRCKTVWR